MLKKKCPGINVFIGSKADQYSGSRLRSISSCGEPQDLGGHALFQFGHRADLMTTEFAANKGVILGTSAKVETVLTALGTIQLDAHDATRS